jgi:hypothetical protein
MQPIDVSICIFYELSLEPSKLMALFDYLRNTANDNTTVAKFFGLPTKGIFLSVLFLSILRRCLYLHVLYSNLCHDWEFLDHGIKPLLFTFLKLWFFFGQNIIYD